MSDPVGFLNLYDSPELGGLTATRTLASTSFLGRFAIMDFAMSNFTNSGIDEINILVKDNFRSVSKHVGSLKPWVNNTKAARQHILINEKGIFSPRRNTDLNNILVNDWVILEAKASRVVIQPAHIITRLDLRKVLASHIASGARITMVYQDVENADKAFLTSDILTVEDGRVVGIRPNDHVTPKASVSLETYVIDVDFLYELIDRHPKHGYPRSLKKVLRGLGLKRTRVNAFRHEGYARSFDSLGSFMWHSFELLEGANARELFDRNWPIYTLTHNTPPSFYGRDSSVQNAYVANGAIIEGSVRNAIISRRVRVAKGAIIKNSIVLTGTSIGPGADIENAVIDKYVHVYGKAVVKGTPEEPVYVEQGKRIR